MYVLLLDDVEINNYENRKLNANDGMGQKAQGALLTYTSRLGCIQGQGFGPEDTSNAQAVIKELLNQMKKISETAADVDCMIDDLVRSLKEDILDKEDELANKI
ncbi:MAG: hypothetical protein J6U23_12190 [Clostridiales bacterium]|nr:hypothetical protein [Clostridiales bacterium]